MLHIYIRAFYMNLKEGGERISIKIIAKKVFCSRFCITNLYFIVIHINHVKFEKLIKALIHIQIKY